jgi:hypothetical protein
MKKQISIDTSSWIGGQKGKILGSILAIISATAIAYNVGHGNGYKVGFSDGDISGWDRGAEAGVEKGYWVGREDGCMWIITESGRSYVIGIGNPNGGWLFQNLGETYFSHEPGPKLEVPYNSGSETTRS